MAKPPKRSASGKKPAQNGGRRHERAPERGEGRGEKPSKRDSFRKREQDDSRKSSPFGGRGGERREGGRRDEPRRDRVRDSRPAASEDRKKFEDRPREPKSPRLKADLFGMHAVREAWANPKRYVHNLYITETAMKEFEPYLKTETKRPEPVIVTKDELDKAFSASTVHQGIALSCQPLAEASITDIIIKGTQKPRSVVVMLDQVTDPHNIGAILRSACAFGADGVVMQSKHAPEMAGVLAKTACGAMEHIDVAYETNLSRTLEKLQENHYTVIGLDEHSPKTFADLPKYERTVIVLGAEGPGIRRLIREHCDVLVTLPTQKPINSLNVSNAAAVALYALTA